SVVPALSRPISGDFVREEHVPGSELLIYAHPFTERTGQRYMIEVGAPYEQIEIVLYGLLLALALGFPLTVIVAVSGGYVLMRKALNPIDAITHTAEQI